MLFYTIMGNFTYFRTYSYRLHHMHLSFQHIIPYFIIYHMPRKSDCNLYVLSCMLWYFTGISSWNNVHVVRILVCSSITFIVSWVILIKTEIPQSRFQSLIFFKYCIQHHKTSSFWVLTSIICLWSCIFAILCLYGICVLLA